MSRQGLVSSRVPPPGGAYSHLTIAQGLVFTAGMGPHDPTSGAIPEGIEAQTEATLRNLGQALSEVDLSLDDVVKTTVHLAELERDFAAFNSVYQRFFTEPYPVRTTVGSSLLGILVEIDVVAARGDGDRG